MARVQVSAPGDNGFVEKCTHGGRRSLAHKEWSKFGPTLAGFAVVGRDGSLIRHGGQQKFPQTLELGDCLNFFTQCAKVSGGCCLLLGSVFKASSAMSLPPTAGGGAHVAHQLGTLEGVLAVGHHSRRGLPSKRRVASGWRFQKCFLRSHVQFV